MRIRMLLAVVVAVLLGTAPAALGQTVSVGSFQLIGGERVVAEHVFGLRASGEVQITFRGDPASGCAVHGVCAYSGTAIWKPAATATAQLLVLRHGRTVHYEGFTDFPQDAGIVGEIVRRSAPGSADGVCADASVPEDLLTITGRRASLAFAPDVTVAGRCTGPLDEDLARLLPRVVLPAHAITRNRIRLDLSGTRAFSSHGLSGTLSSTIVVTGRTMRTSASTLPPSKPTHRTRIVSESIAVVRGSGSMRALISGAQDATVCSLLDSCGVHGEITWTIRPRPGTGMIWASGPATLPLRAYRVALGLARGRPNRHIIAFGAVDWNERGMVQESITGGGGTCTDSVPAGTSGTVLAVYRGELRASYGSSTNGRTRCPGPILSTDAPSLAGAIALSRAHGQFPIHLVGSGTVTDDGYTGRESGSLTLTLRRGRVTQQIRTY